MEKRKCDCKPSASISKFNFHGQNEAMVTKEAYEAKVTITTGVNLPHNFVDIEIKGMDVLLFGTKPAEG
jgi:hypothetical protein